MMENETWMNARKQSRRSLTSPSQRRSRASLCRQPMTKKTGRASKGYKSNFWNAMRKKAVSPDVMSALQIGTDTEGGYLVPDEYEHTLVEALEEENIFRKIANVISTASGDRKIPVVATKGTASWVDEEGRLPKATIRSRRYLSAHTSSERSSRFRRNS